MGVKPVSDVTLTQKNFAGLPQLKDARTVHAAVCRIEPFSKQWQAARNCSPDDCHMQESDEELLSQAIASKSARRRTRRRRQRETNKAAVTQGSWVPHVMNARIPWVLDTASELCSRETVTLGDLGFELVNPSCGQVDFTGSCGAFSRPWQFEQMESQIISPCAPEYLASAQSFGKTRGVSVVSHLGLDTIGALDTIQSSMPSTTSSECSEVRFCSVTSTAQFWMPVKPNVCHGRIAEVMRTGLTSGSNVVGDASSRIPCVLPPATEGFLTQTFGGHRYGVPEPYEFMGFDGIGEDTQPTQSIGSDPLEVLLPGGAQHQNDLAAQLRAAVPEVYEE